MLFISVLLTIVQPLLFGDMESWTVRYIQESKIIGGKKQTLYALAPTDTVWENAVFTYGVDGNPWASSNAYAVVMGIQKGAPSMRPEWRDSTNGYCCRMDVYMAQVKVLGMIDLEVLVAGTLFTGRCIEPIKTAKDPYQNIDFGVPFIERPNAFVFDYKSTISPETWVWYAKGFGKPKKQDGHDIAQAECILQRRWEDKKGHIFAERVGTGRLFIDTTVSEWKNNVVVPIHYGDISQENIYLGDNELHRPDRMLNSKGDMVPIEEVGYAEPGTAPTHMTLVFTSGHYEAFVGHDGNTLWVDNVKLIYDE